MYTRACQAKEIVVIKILLHNGGMLCWSVTAHLRTDV